MRVEILRGYRGKPTNEQYLVPGEHDLDPALAAYLVDNGHAIALESEPLTTNIDLLLMTVSELREYASDNDISLGGATRKDDIIAAIEAADGD